MRDQTERYVARGTGKVLQTQRNGADRSVAHTPQARRLPSDEREQRLETALLQMVDSRQRKKKK